MIANTLVSNIDTVYVLDDEPAVCDSLRCLLETERFHVRTFASPEQFLASLDIQQPSCLILDLKMPAMHGLEVLRRVIRERPALATIVLTAFADVPSVVAAMRSGAVDLIEKPCSDEQLVFAVHKALAQAKERHQQLSDSGILRTKLDRLTARERVVLKELVAGKSSKDISEKLGTSANTVRNQRASIMDKLGAASPTDLVRMILEGRGP